MLLVLQVYKQYLFAGELLIFNESADTFIASFSSLNAVLCSKIVFLLSC